MFRELKPSRYSRRYVPDFGQGAATRPIFMSMITLLVTVLVPIAMSYVAVEEWVAR
jgi:hypothetical protein